jgi:hypothetical protein
MMDAPSTERLAERGVEEREVFGMGPDGVCTSLLKDTQELWLRSHESRSPRRKSATAFGFAAFFQGRFFSPSAFGLEMPPILTPREHFALLTRPPGQRAASRQRVPSMVYAVALANTALIERIKEIVGRAKGGDLDGAYDGYRDLFASGDFASYAVGDQRQALRLMISMKNTPRPATPAMAEAHRTASALLSALVAAHRDPADHELLGICHVVLGDEAGASNVFRAGLALERERDPQSKLCGVLMKRVSEL